jgi:tetratricopeptide (TPR) repeat protein
MGKENDSLGDFEKAVEYHTQHLEVAKELRDRDGEVSACGGLGNAYWSLGDFGKAIEYYKQHLAMQRRWAPGRRRVSLQGIWVMRIIR